MVLLGFFPRMIARPLLWLIRFLPLRDKLQRAVATLNEVGPWQGALLLALSIGTLVISLFQFVLLIRATGATLPWMGGMLAGILTFFVKGAIPVFVGSLGVGEWVAMYCFRGLAVAPSSSVAASLILFFMNVLIPSLIGLPFLSSLRVPDFHKSGDLL